MRVQTNSDMHTDMGLNTAGNKENGYSHAHAQEQGYTGVDIKGYADINTD